MTFVRACFKLFLFLILLCVTQNVFAYPDEEKAQISISDITAQATQMAISSDNRYLYVGFNNKVKKVDLGIFALAPSSDQPYDFGSDPDLNGVVGGLALSASRMYVCKDDGDMLSFDLSDLAAEPTSTTISSGSALGKMVITTDKARIYMLDTSNNNVILYSPSTGDKQTIPISTSGLSVNLNDIALGGSISSGNDYIYVAATKGRVFYIVDGTTTAQNALVATASDAIAKVAVSPDKTEVYAVKSGNEPTLYVLNPTTLEVSQTVPVIIDTSGATDLYNSTPSGLISANVSDPSAVYTYLSGLYGVSVFNGSNQLMDVGSGSYTYNPITISNERRGPLIASGDGYIYESNSDGSISVITAKPYVSVSGVTYSGGGSSLGAHESATITYRSDETGTYSVKVGGGIDQSGAALLDASGSSTGTIAAASTDQTFTFNYDDNSSNLEEGTNTVFFFVTNGDATGRGGTTITVDTPPPAPTVNSTGYGNNTVYVNMNRVTASDMSYYNFYVSADPDAVKDKTVTPVRVDQPPSGATMTAELTGLSNGTLYYVSVEAVDASGNVSALTYTYASGGRITGRPEYTVGPAQLAGEKGCSLVRGGRVDGGLFIAMLLAAVVALEYVRWILRRPLGSSE